ncbi:MAG: hypothetical protein M9962_13860 [Oligoflexia bacterium]|nr:hypothetical protein [Oligoflexia bacterium]
MDEKLVNKMKSFLAADNKWLRRIGYFGPFLLLFLTLSVVVTWIEQNYFQFLIYLILTLFFVSHSMVAAYNSVKKQNPIWKKYGIWQIISIVLTVFVWVRPVILNMFFLIE